MTTGGPKLPSSREHCRLRCAGRLFHLARQFQRVAPATRFFIYDFASLGALFSPSPRQCPVFPEESALLTPARRGLFLGLAVLVDGLAQGVSRVVASIICDFKTIELSGVNSGAPNA